MIDFISITKCNCKDNPYLGNCKLQCAYQSGSSTYSLDGCERMKIMHNPFTNVLKVQGSLPYFLNGHNFTFTLKDFVQAVDLLDALLGGVGLWGADVDEFENGIIAPVDMKPKIIIAHHSAISPRLKKMMNEKNAGKCVTWNQGNDDFKLYDAGANIKMKQSIRRRQVIEAAGWNPDAYYLKAEVRYHKPERLNGGQPLKLESLQDNKFLEMLKLDLMEHYHQLAPARALVYPTDKKNLKTLDAVIYALLEICMNQLAMHPSEARKIINNTINQASCLTKGDKDARKAQIRKAFAKISEEEFSRWDMTERLENALEAENQPSGSPQVALECECVDALENA